MNGLDLVVIVILVSAAVGGWRLGFLARVFAWSGLAAGLIVGAQFVQRVVTSFGGTNTDDRVTLAVIFLVLTATVGQAAGLGVGLLVDHHFGGRRPLSRRDRVAGASLGTVGVLVLVWMIIPSLASANGWPARMARGSLIVGLVDDITPRQPAQLAALGRDIADAPYPSALGAVDDPPDPGPPPEFSITEPVDARVRESIVKVTGLACDRDQSGTGWVYAPGLVVTAAHVVAGEKQTNVRDAEGNDYDATVVGFDLVLDLAVLEVADLEARPLMLARGHVGDVGAVYGHPDGRSLRPTPAGVGHQILTVDFGIPGSQRNVFVLAASLVPGDSGGPLVNRSGRAIGVAFAVDNDDSNMSYAIADADIRAFVDGTGDQRVDTGDCLA